ncbi:6-phospho-5-dehydro-2-deoxy-D-gluconate aldolase [Aerococcus urinaehominis]|uniref:6-phospho-5-dehydro-2-deoxy-D-gluconate aldolase n=1 Tax=Aerococcus urinaehominis TaxID=128944 RepID=A0A0X8FKX5_9LACT|nr:class II fructose-1,6-bisphosphate aldolase [Aerococcus urinaehominis]AMB99209.1 6-phospho-5-dehydro-2-deoxy-D-gluconate aldolase [Aerococcus urinaehominis]SDM32311.1 6-phospho-5-dehydro-2-deoxy-D-gluconate aldolase [Aerococcus urinaehominis]
MALVNMVDMLEKARKEHYAVAQLNINNLEWTQAVLEAAQAENSPVILGVSEGAGKYMGGPEVVAAMVKQLLENMEITVPVALHLDHGSSFDACKRAIDAGYTSVMIDMSHHPIDDNIAVTKQVVDYAHERGASVEAEIGTVGGTEDGVTGGIQYADPQECLRLTKEAGIDALAAALGSVHGPYQGEPVLGFDEMQEIADLTQMPLVLHGGSGIPADQIKKAIQRGHAKINVNTELQQVFTAATRELLDENKEVYDPRKVLAPGKAAIVETARKTLQGFGSSGKA